MPTVDEWATRVASAWSSNDPGDVVLLFTEDGVRHEFGMTVAVVRGADALREHAAGLYARRSGRGHGDPQCL